MRWRRMGPSATELLRAKAQLKAGLLMSLESSSSRAEQMARQLIGHNRIISQAELIQRVDAVSAEDVGSSLKGLRKRAPPSPSSARGRRRSRWPRARLSGWIVPAASSQGGRDTWRFSGSVRQWTTWCFRHARLPAPQPQPGDYVQWAELRALSRAHLTPWEPTWPRDDLTKSSYRRRVRHYQREARDDLGYAFLIFDVDTHALLGGITLSHVRRGRYAGGYPRLLDGQALRRTRQS